MICYRRLLCCSSPTEICRSVEGKAFETDTPKKEDVPYLMLSKKQEGDRLICCIACDEKPGEPCLPVAATMDDAFLYIYIDEADYEDSEI